MKINEQLLNEFYSGLDDRSKESLDAAAEKILETKRRGGKVVVATGSGPNLHEGVTTLIAELMEKGLVDGITTSSAVIGHEMCGALDLVKMCSASALGFDERFMPRGGVFEFTQLDEDQMNALRAEMILDADLLAKGERAEGRLVIKAAGNMAYPMGLRNENLAGEILVFCKALGLPFETVAGWGADRRTMLGAGAALGLPVLVSGPPVPEPVPLAPEAGPPGQCKAGNDGGEASVGDDGGRSGSGRGRIGGKPPPATDPELFLAGSLRPPANLPGPLPGAVPAGRRLSRKADQLTPEAPRRTGSSAFGRPSLAKPPGDRMLGAWTGEGSGARGNSGGAKSFTLNSSTSVR